MKNIDSLFNKLLDIAEKLGIFYLLVSFVITWLMTRIGFIPGLEPDSFGSDQFLFNFLAYLIINFLVIHFVAWIIKREKSHRESVKKSDKESYLLMAENVTKLWDWMDRLEINEHSVVMKLFLSGNEVIYDYAYYPPTSVFYTKWFNYVSCVDEKKIEEYGYKPSLSEGLGNFHSYPQLNEISLNVQTYTLMLISYNQFKKLSHSDREHSQLINFKPKV